MSSLLSAMILLSSSVSAQNEATTSPEATAPVASAAAPAEAAPASGAAASEGLFPEKEFYTKEEVQVLRELLEKKSTQLDQDIDTQKKYVESLKVQVQEHLAKIEAARTEIADFMNERDEKEESKLKKLARFYEAMDAEQAAPLLKDVSDDMVIKIFDRMDTKKAGQILALVPANRAAKLTAKFPKLRLQAEAKPPAERN